jgi:hypothetical protein
VGRGGGLQTSLVVNDDICLQYLLLLFITRIRASIVPVYFRCTYIICCHNFVIGYDLEEEDSGADSGCDDGPAGHEEIAGVVANHVLQRLTESPATTSIIFCTASRNLLQQHQSYSSEAHGTSCNNINHILQKLTEPPATTSIIFFSSSQNLLQQQKSYSSVAHGSYRININHVLQRLKDPIATIYHVLQ